MDHRTRANQYAEQLKEAKEQIFALECELADLTERGTKAGQQTTTTEGQALTQQDLPTPSAEPNIKLEDGPPPSGLEELRAENARLQTDLEHYTMRIKSIEDQTAVSAADVIDTLKNLKDRIESATGTENALRQQIRKHVANAKKQSEASEKCEKERDKAVSEARKYRTDMKRFFETGLKAAWIKDLEGTSLGTKGSSLGEGGASAPATPLATTPRTPGSLASKRRPYVLDDCEEDDEEDLPLRHRKVGRMSASG